MKRTITSILISALFVLALAGCSTTWTNNPKTDGGVDVEQAIQDGLTAPASQISYTTVTSKWSAMVNTADDACVATLSSNADSFTPTFDQLALDYNQAQATIAAAGDRAPAGYPITVPVMAQTQLGSADWCSVRGILADARQ